MTNILITGVLGFIASHFLNFMVDRYPKLNFIGVDKYSYCSNWKNIESILDKTNFKFVKGDIKNLDFMDYIFDNMHVNIVFHFAAYTHVDHSFGNSLEFTENNVYGTHVLLELAKKYKIEKFIHISTDEVYGNSMDISTENSLPLPTNPYAATKMAAEHLVFSYYRSFKLPVIVTRGNNVYGPKQYPEKVIPKFIYRLLHKLPCTIQGYGNQVRSFLYIDDVVNAFDIIYQKGKIGEIYNIGCNINTNEISILNLAKSIISHIYPNSISSSWIIHTKDREFNDQRYNISNNKLSELGWSQTIDFQVGLLKTIQWYKSNPTFWPKEEIQTIINQF